MLCRLLDYVAEAINAALQQQLARLRPSDGPAAAPLLDLSAMPFVGVRTVFTNSVGCGVQRMFV